MRVNAVATSPSSTRLLDLARQCLSLGVPELTISPYVEPSSPGQHTSSSSASDHHWLKLWTASKPGPVGAGIKLSLGSAEAAASGRVDCGDRLLCEVGLQTLDILPDGRVTRCRYLPHDEGLVVGDLRTQSLMDVWNSRSLLALTLPVPSSLAIPPALPATAFSAATPAVAVWSPRS